MTKIQPIDVYKLKRVDQLKGKYKDFLTDEEILKLASDKLIPHYILKHPISNKDYYYFLNSEVDEWFLNNYVKHEKCVYEQQITILSFDYDCYKIEPEDNEHLPRELIAIRNLYKFPLSKHSGTPPAVYFLCREGKIVYIGQSMNIAERIIEHMNIKYSDKKFTHIYFFPCHKNNLIDAEAALIKQFRPEYNMNHNRKSIEYV